jgi:hypothetical protein
MNSVTAYACVARGEIVPNAFVPALAIYPDEQVAAIYCPPDAEVVECEIRLKV